MDHVEPRGVTIIADCKTFSFQLKYLHVLPKKTPQLRSKAVLVQQFLHISFNDIALNEYKFRSSIG